MKTAWNKSEFDQYHYAANTNKAWIDPYDLIKDIVNHYDDDHVELIVRHALVPDSHQTPARKSGPTGA